MDHESWNSPIPSTYGIFLVFTYIWLFLMVKYGKCRYKYRSSHGLWHGSSYPDLVGEWFDPTDFVQVHGGGGM